jgi:hypothetical protein
VVLAGGYVEAGDQGRMRVAAGHVLLHRAYEALRLATWSGTLAGLAAEYGFADHAHLSRTLVSMTGVPPAAMRLRRLNDAGALRSSG